MNYLDMVATAIQCLTEDPVDPSGLPLYRVYAVLCLAKGEATTDEDVHNAWAAWTANESRGAHPSLRPFSELAPNVQALDTPYTEAIRCVAAEMRRQGVTG